MKKLVSAVLLICVLLCGCTLVVRKENLPEKEEDIQAIEEKLPQSSLKGKIIVLDPGHGIYSHTKKEAVAPGATQTKPAYVFGTSGINQTEEQLNLSVALKLRKALEKKGAIIHMTRTEHECEVSNIERAQLANELNADIAVRIHADGNTNSSVHGASVLVPGGQYIKDSELLEKSRKAGETVLEAFVLETGAVNRGIYVRNDLTGFNWSTVPVILVEMGFMTNPGEDRLMETEEYQNKMVSGMLKGLEKYFE